MSSSLATLLVAAALVQQPPQAPPPATVAVTPVITHGFQPVIDVLGDVRTPRDAYLGAELDGLVKRILVHPGDRVAAGDPVVELDTALLQFRIARARGELDLASEQLAELLAGSRPEEIEEAAASLAQAEAMATEAKLRLERIRNLLGDDIASQQAFDEAEAAEHSARATVKERAAILDRVKNGPRPQEIARARAQVAVRQAELDELLEEERKSTVRAPFDAVVAERLLAEGAFVQRGEPVLRLIQVDPIEVFLDVPEQYAAGVRAGQDLQVFVDAYPDDPIAAQVAGIVPTADRAARTFPVRVVLENDAQRLLPGMAARARVPLAEAHRALAVPIDALVPTALGQAVYLARDGVAVQVAVVPGLTEGTLVEVHGDLKDGDPVVVRGNERLFPGQPLVIVGGDAPR